MCFWRRKKKKEEALKEQKVQKEEKVEEPKVEEEKPEVKEEPKKEEAPEVKDIYHVSQNKDKKSEHEGKWRVRKQGSNKTIKYFDTQAEAIEFAKDLAKKADGHIVIHKRDGSIRKQNY